MKTQLPQTITTAEEAKAFLDELWRNGETFHPDDNAHDIVWCSHVDPKPTFEQCEQLNNLMDDMLTIPHFDPYSYLLEKSMPC